ncbi:MAG: two-component system sensor histidine kinase NtrB [Myxococcota bacterium]
MQWPWSEFRIQLPDRRWSLVAIVVLVFATSLLHYATDPMHTPHHDFFRRLYYVPIVWGAFAFGLRGGLGTAAAATALYLPHAFLLMHHLDPASPVEKAAEMFLYFAIGGLAGFLVDRERRATASVAAAALQRAQAEADAARLAGLVHLTRGLAHEIRNPLGGMQGAIEILASAVPADRPERRMGEIGLREVARLDRALSDFLEFARPRPPSLERLGADVVVRDVGLLLDADARARGIRFRHSADPTLSAVRADRDQLVQVLVNLVRNALEATGPDGDVELAARAVRVESGRPAVRFEVRDTGHGVPEHLGTAIFDPYVTGRDHGTGLGLSIAANLVRQNGGLLTHHARDGGGTVFHFTLPATEEAG